MTQKVAPKIKNKIPMFRMSNNRLCAVTPNAIYVREQYMGSDADLEKMVASTDKRTWEPDLSEWSLVVTAKHANFYLVIKDAGKK